MKQTTVEVYAKDVNRFIKWGGIIPTQPEQLVRYLEEHSHTHKYATLCRWLASINNANFKQEHNEPLITTSLVQRTMKNIKKRIGSEQRCVTKLTNEQVQKIVSKLGHSVRDKRDKLLIVAGHSLKMKRSNLVSATISDLALLKPKYGYLLNDWLEVANIKQGSIFRSIDRHSKISKKSISGHGVAIILKRLVSLIGLNPTNYSVNSLLN